jgi:hypothetical protein
MVYLGGLCINDWKDIFDVNSDYSEGEALISGDNTRLWSVINCASSHCLTTENTLNCYFLRSK